MIGETLGHYEIVELLGQGGMGQVYRARDPKLGREVAIKVLPREMSGDPERIARFRREARMLATLQHANVATIHGFEDDGQTRFLVMELVDGEDLSKRLGRGPVDTDEASEIARQIAHGLEAAHEQGVVHRDLKPANVKLTPAGSVKILDFGLARAYVGDEGQGDPAESPTITAAMTQAGVVLGTAAYMSPEQARGRAVDKRADVWSFGVMLYEMLTGGRLFAGETVSDTLAGVLKTEIDLGNLPSSCPPHVRRLLDRCLDRDVKTRLRDIGEARIALESPAAAEAEAAPSPRPTAVVPWVVLAAVAGMVLGAGVLHFVAKPAPVEAPTERAIQMAISRTGTGTPRSALDPSGTRIAYRDVGGLWVRAIGEATGRLIPDTEDALVVTWSPDGEWIAYADLKTIYRVRPDGSRRTRVSVIETDMHDWAGSIGWTEDDRIVYTTGDAGTFAVSSHGGDARPLVEPDSTEVDFHSIAVLPESRGVLFHPHRDLIFDSIDLFDGVERREVLRLDGSRLNHVQYGAGYLVFDREGSNPGVWAVPFSLETSSVTGEPFLVASDSGFPTLSRRGDLAFVTRGTMAGQMARLDANGLVIEEIGDSIREAGVTAISRDGRLAAQLVGPPGNNDLWVIDLETGERRRINTNETQLRTPSWSPDGLRIAVTIGRTGPELRTLILELDGDERQVIPVRGESPCFTPDGRSLVMSTWNDANEADIGVVSIDDPSSPTRVLADTKQEENRPDVSPDGKLVAYESIETGRREIYVVPFDGGRKIQVSYDGGGRPFWSPEGDVLYFISASGGEWMASQMSRDPLRFGTPYVKFDASSRGDITPLADGTSIARLIEVAQADELRIWINWASTLGRDVP